jgi:hypothetical protein
VSARPSIPADFGHRFRPAVLHSAATGEAVKVAWVLLDWAYTHKSTVVETSRRDLAEATGLTERSVRRALANLAGLGLVALEESGGGRSRPAVWRLLDPAESGAMRATFRADTGANTGALTGANTGALTGAPARQASLSKSYSPLPGDRALTRAPADGAGEVDAQDRSAGGVQALVAHYCDLLAADGVPRVDDLVRHVAKWVKRLVDQGVPDATIRRALELMYERDLHPSTLPTLIPEASRGPRRRGREPLADRMLRDLRRDLGAPQ